MFTGIVRDAGTIAAVRPRGGGRTLIVQTVLPLATGPLATAQGAVQLGDSIAVMGACLTVEGFEGADAFVASVGRETVERTTLGRLTVGAGVHLERALRLGDRLDGHLVSGHVDGVGRVVEVRQDQESRVMWLDLPGPIRRYVAEKGSVAVDGVSLTVNEVDGGRCRINVVPYTMDGTLLGRLRPSDTVNIEVDLLSRYLERLLGAGVEPTGGQLTRERLVALGFATSGRDPGDTGDP